MTKYERRQLFALKVAKEEEERQRRQQQESWQEHENRCLALGIDPHTTAMVDPQTGYPVFYNPTLGQWQHYPTQGHIRHCILCKNIHFLIIFLIKMHSYNYICKMYVYNFCN